jgi:hypothetical protein
MSWEQVFSEDDYRLFRENRSDIPQIAAGVSIPLLDSSSMDDRISKASYV